MNVNKGNPRAEMEVNPLLQNVIAVYHIIQVVSPVVFGIITGLTMGPFYLLFLFPSALIPTILFIIFWIASKCNYQDLRRILVHFNFVLSLLWFIVFLVCSILYATFAKYISWTWIPIPILTGLLSLSSAIFMVYGIWKSARNVVLSARPAEPPYDTLVGFTDPNDSRLPQENYAQIMSNQ